MTLSKSDVPLADVLAVLRRELSHERLYISGASTCVKRAIAAIQRLAEKPPRKQSRCRFTKRGARCQRDSGHVEAHMVKRGPFTIDVPRKQSRARCEMCGGMGGCLRAGDCPACNGTGAARGGGRGK